MQQLRSEISMKLGDREYRLNCDPQSPIGEAKEACFQFLKYLGQLEDQAKAAQAEQEKSVEEQPKQDDLCQTCPKE